MRGLTNNNKHRETFCWLKKKNYSIHFLQEVHCKKIIEHIWTAEWGYHTIFGASSSSSAGVGILFSNNFEFQILKQLSDPDGRYIFCDIKVEDKIWTLVNVYAPNQDEPTFFEQIQDLLASFECEQIIFGGDFNLILDIIKDKLGGKKTTHFKSLKKLESIMESLDMVDIWRIQNPDTKHYTWRRKNPNIQCRLDFFLISSSLCTDISETDILPGYKTDHSLVTLAIDLHTNPRGPGFWKLNTSLLYDHEFIELIKRTISDVSK